jgi:hypothetical protein
MRKLLSNDSGAAIIELALIAPIFAMLAIGVIDMSNAYSRKLAIEQGAQRAIEKIMQTTEDNTVEGTLKTEAVCQVNGTDGDGECKDAPITADDVTVDTKLECIAADGTATPNDDPDAMCPEDQEPARYISVTIRDTYSPMFPLRFSGYKPGTGDGDEGGYPITATAGMRTQ